jgi:hypothetical protein
VNGSTRHRRICLMDADSHSPSAQHVASLPRKRRPKYRKSLTISPFPQHPPGRAMWLFWSSIDAAQGDPPYQRMPQKRLGRSDTPFGHTVSR